MSINNQINNNKNEIEMENSPKKSEISKEEEIKNPNYITPINNFPSENIEKKFKLINSYRISNKIQSKYKKLNSFNYTGNHTFKKENIKFSVYSEQERYNRITKKLSKHNNNMNQRVKIFVPSEEYLDLLEEIDAENNSDDNSIDINNNSEEVKLDNRIMNNIIDETNSENKNCNFRIKNKISGFNLENKSDNISSTSRKDNKCENHQDEKINNLISIKRILREKRELKYIKDFDTNFDIFLTEVYFKYGEYNNNIKKYNKCFLLLKKHFLFLFEQKTFNFEKFKSNLDINNLLNISFPLLCLNFNLLSCALLINKNKNTKEFEIKILGTTKNFSFIIKDERLFNKYIYIINSKINNSEGFKQNKIGLTLRNNSFYNEIYITVSEFETMAKTGDILLFQTMDKYASLQRAYTCDNYDHVGIILKENNGIKIFESTSIGKCSPLSWNHFKILFFNLVYKKIALRKLNYENKDKKFELENKKNIEEKCKNFFREIKGKNYYLAISKFLCCQKPEKYEYEKNFQKSDGFCCSALAAALYIKIGIAKLIKSVHSTKPGDFEQRNNKIYFEDGYSLGPEQIIDFSG